MFVFSFLCNLTDMFLWLKWMYCIDIIPIGLLKGNIQVQALPLTLYVGPLWCPPDCKMKWTFTVKSLSQLKWEFYWLYVLSLSLGCLPTWWPSLLTASGNVTETRDAGVCTTVCLKFWACCDILICTSCWEPMKSVRARHCYLWWRWRSDILGSHNHNGSAIS